MNCTNRVVPVGEASVMIAVSAEHRKEALEAVSYAIDQVKSTAAIWKKVYTCLSLFFVIAPM